MYLRERESSGRLRGFPGEGSSSLSAAAYSILGAVLPPCGQRAHIPDCRCRNTPGWGEWVLKISGLGLLKAYPVT